MITALKLTLSWLLYLLGLVTDRLLVFGLPVSITNWLMTTSERLQGSHPRGPWGE